MNGRSVMEEVASVLADITGLRVFGYPPATVVPPAGYVSYPREVRYGTSYGPTGVLWVDLPVTVVVGKVNDRNARDRVMEYADNEGLRSVQQLLEGHAWASCDDVTVGSASFDVETVAGVDYLAVVFLLSVAGTQG